MAVSIRPITPADTPNILRWRNSEDVRRHFIFQETLTAEAHAVWLRDMVDSGKTAQFIITCDELGDVGSVYLRDIDPRHSKAEYGIFIGKSAARGQGVGTAAARLALAYAFTKLGLNKVFLRVFAENHGAIRSYERAGFRQEGLFLEDVMVSGQPRDMIFMAVLRKDYTCN